MTASSSMLIACAAMTAAHAQQAPQTVAPEWTIKTELPLDVSFLFAERLMQQHAAIGVGDPADLRRALEERGLRLHPDELSVQIEVQGRDGDPLIPPGVIRDFGGEVTNECDYMSRSEAWMPLDRIRAFAQRVQRLQQGRYFIEIPANYTLDDTGGEGATTINSETYRDGGADGGGLDIAVIDLGYQQFNAAQAAGDAPPLNQIIRQQDYIGTGMQAGTPHGTGCTEAAYDHCPGADWLFYRIGTLTDLGAAVSDAISNGADVITHSISWYNTGWADHSGPACAAADNAANNGILFFTSAGNRAQDHWQGDWNNPDNDNWHEWINGDELLRITIAPSTATTTTTTRINLQWDLSGGVYDLDLFLYDSDQSTVLASSTNPLNFYEQLSWSNPNTSTRTAYLAVRFSGGGTTEFEVFGDNQVTSWEHEVAAGSTTSPSNTVDSRVISVGAVDWNDHDSGNGASGIIMNYSSRGPSNEGRTLPDLSGPTNTNTTSYSGSFGGTSCATPNCAGAACALWSADTGLDDFAITWLLTEHAEAFKDWGASGDDDIYGHGGAFLYDYAFGTRWLARSYGNISENPAFPFYTLEAAYSDAPNNGRVLVFPGGSYPEAVSLTAPKSIRIETAKDNANLGF